MNTSIFVPFTFLFLTHILEVKNFMLILLSTMCPLQVQQFSFGGGQSRQFKTSIIFFFYFSFLIHEINAVSFLPFF
jgi:hypothetical protein